jgi:ligand-binding sensor domain-containing protein/putative methionine-R-sulfoxide reductase with GAF domain/anti-sigma regulatory factor (Ser/Thr protein kinase)
MRIRKIAKSLFFNVLHTCSVLRNLLVLLFLTLSFASRLSGQQMPIEWRVTNYDESKGLSNRKITRLLQDAKGYLWIGTADGLIRFDGYSFRNYHKIPEDSSSIGANYISYLARDKNNNIWIGFLTGGMSCYNLTSGKFTNYYPGDRAGSLPASEISCIFIDKDGIVWVGVAQRGLFRLDKRSGKFSSFDISSFDDPFYSGEARKVYNTVYGIHEDKDGLLWAATHDGLYTFNKTQKKFSNILKSPLKKGMLRNDCFGTIVADSTGFWLGAWAGGLSHYDRRSGKWDIYKYDSAHVQNETKNIVSDIRLRENGMLWVASLDRGFGIFNIATRRFLFFGDQDGFHKNIPSTMAYKVMEDLEKNIWISHIGGLTKIEQRKRLFPFRNLPVTHSDINMYYEVTFILHDADSINTYIGTSYSDGFYVVNRKTADTARLAFDIKQGEENFLVSSDIIQDKNGQVWVLTRDYLFKYDKKRKKLVHTAGSAGDTSRSPGFKRMLQDKEGMIWITSAQGVFRFDPATESYFNFRHDSLDKNSLANDVIRPVAEDKKGNLWFGSIRGGLSIYDKKKNTFKNFYPDYNNSKGLGSNRVWSLLCDSKGNMWVGTDIALYQFNCSGEEPVIRAVYSADKGLNGDLANVLTEDAYGHIWAITPVSLVVINPEKGFVTSYNAQDGLTKQDIGERLIAAPGKKLYMTSVGGYYTFDPLATQPSGETSKVYINSFKVFDKERSFESELLSDQKLLLEPNENFFSFEFVAIDFNRQDRIQYAYMLEGFDKNWIYSGSRRYASYTNLPGGDYVFKVRASLGPALWGKETAIPVHIGSHIYETWWFISLMVLLLAAIGFAFLQKRAKKHKQQKEELETQAAINYFASSLYEQQTVESILWDVARNCIARLHFEDCVIFLVDEERKMLVPKAVHGHQNPNRNDPKNAMEIELGKGIVGSVAVSGKSEIINDTSKDPRYLVGERPRLSEITVPLVFDGEVMGIIDCEHSTRNFFTQKHLFILTTIASICANKIVRVRSEEERVQTQQMLISTQQKMAEAEMQALRAQMNPHFIFNCLNSINRYIVKSDQATASLYLTRFAKLIRLILDNSNSKNVILSNELEALKLYIEMEALRFDKKFDYRIIVDEGVNTDSIEVPPLIIQPYVENAIWHGLLHKEVAGQLTIHVSMVTEGMLQCIIEDNGVGREQAKELKSKSATTRKSLGIKLTEDRISLVNKHARLNASVDIIDLVDDGQPRGTKVIIKIPV